MTARKLSALQVRAMDIKDVVKDPKWQALRQSLVGTWILKPQANVNKLRIYLGEFCDPLKVRRVLNYLTGSGFRGGAISHPSITKLLKEVREVWEQMTEE